MSASTRAPVPAGSGAVDLGDETVMVGLRGWHAWRGGLAAPTASVVRVRAGVLGRAVAHGGWWLREARGGSRGGQQQWVQWVRRRSSSGDLIPRVGSRQPEE
jgi:hypothetical protein